jgi:hypothetical protein
MEENEPTPRKKPSAKKKSSRSKRTKSEFTDKDKVIYINNTQVIDEEITEGE